MTSGWGIFFLLVFSAKNSFAFDLKHQWDFSSEFSEFSKSNDWIDLKSALQFTQTPWSRILTPSATQGIQFGLHLMGPVPLEQNSNLLFAPASNSKLFTLGLAMDLLGPQFRYETRMEWYRVRGSDPSVIQGLRFWGSGDPSWGLEELGENASSRLQIFAKYLALAGVREIRGEIEFLANDERLEKRVIPQGWVPEDETACYGALAQAFNLQINCATLRIEGMQRAYWIEQKVPASFELQLKEGPETHLEIEPVLYWDQDLNAENLSFVIRGSWRVGSPPQDLGLQVRNIKGWLQALFRDLLTEQGIRWRDRRTSFVRTHKEKPALYSFTSFSPPLREVIVPFMKMSINVVGEALIKTVGQKHSEPGSSEELLTAGRRKMAEYISKIGIPTARDLALREIPGFYSDQIELWDGSGISRDSRVSPEVILALLEDFKRHSEFSALWNSLPIAGVDGTLQSRMRGTAAQGVLRAKTGTLRGVYNLSGYVPSLNKNDFVPFVMLSRTSFEKKQATRDLEDQLGVQLTELIRPR